MWLVYNKNDLNGELGGSDVPITMDIDFLINWLLGIRGFESWMFKLETFRVANWATRVLFPIDTVSCEKSYS